MSRIGKLPVAIPDEVKIEIEGRSIKVVGPRGKLEFNFSRRVSVDINGEEIKVTRRSDNKQSRSTHGTTRALIANMVKGVKDGWVKQLSIVGKGYRGQVNGNTLVLTVGYSHPVEIIAPENISFKVDKDKIVVEGIDKEVVGKMAAKIRSVRPPEPYKGKGIRYLEEVVRRKPGKAAKGSDGVAG